MKHKKRWQRLLSNLMELPKNLLRLRFRNNKALFLKTIATV
jgi:hypothetical protein